MALSGEARTYDLPSAFSRYLSPLLRGGFALHRRVPGFDQLVRFLVSLKNGTVHGTRVVLGSVQVSVVFFTVGGISCDTEQQTLLDFSVVRDAFSFSLFIKSAVILKSVHGLFHELGID